MRECHTKLLGMALSQIEKNRLSGISTFLKKIKQKAFQTTPNSKARAFYLKFYKNKPFAQLPTNQYLTAKNHYPCCWRDFSSLRLDLIRLAIKP